MSIRTELNANAPNRLADMLHGISLGELLSLLIKNITPTETGVTPSSNVATLAATPTAMLQVNATTATVTGIKTLIFSGTPVTGQALWVPGTATVTFAAADAVTAASFTYAKSTDKASIIEASV